MESKKGNSSTTSARISVGHQHRFPAHDPNLKQILLRISRPEVATIHVSVGSQHDTQPPTELVVRLSENLPDEEEPAQILPTKLESPSNQIQLELPSITINSDLNILTRFGQRTTRALALNSGILTDEASVDVDIETPDLQVVDAAASEEVEISDSPPTGSHHHRNPKRIAYLLAMYPTFLGVVKLIIWENHMSSFVVGPFIIISVVAYAMAFLDLCILAWMYEFFGNSNSPHQDVNLWVYKNVNLCWYMILQVVYYMLCFLAIILFLPMFLIPQSQPPRQLPPH